MNAVGPQSRPACVNAPMGRRPIPPLVLTKKPAEGGLFVTEHGGADRDRTDDLLNAIQALSQLSYGPTGTVFVTNGGVCVNKPSFRNPTIRGQKLGRLTDPLNGWVDRASSIQHRGSGGWPDGVLELPLRGSAWGLVASADFKSVGPASVGSVGGFDSLALPPPEPGWRMRTRLDFTVQRVEVDVERRIRLQE